MASIELHFLAAGVLLVYGDVLVTEGRKLTFLLDLASSEVVLRGRLELRPLGSEVAKHELLLLALHLQPAVHIPLPQRMVIDEVHGVVHTLSLRPIRGLLLVRLLQRYELRRFGDPRLLVIIVHGAQEARFAVIGGLTIDVHQRGRSITFRAIETESVGILRVGPALIRSSLARDELVPPLQIGIALGVFGPENVYHGQLPPDVAESSADKPEPSIDRRNVGDHVTLDEGVVLLMLGVRAVLNMQGPAVADEGEHELIADHGEIKFDYQRQISLIAILILKFVVCESAFPLFGFYQDVETSVDFPHIRKKDDHDEELVECSHEPDGTSTGDSGQSFQSFVVRETLVAHLRHLVLQVCYEGNVEGETGHINEIQVGLNVLPLRRQILGVQRLRGLLKDVVSDHVNPRVPEEKLYHTDLLLEEAIFDFNKVMEERHYNNHTEIRIYCED